MLGSRTRARANARPSVTWRPTLAPRARAVEPSPEPVIAQGQGKSPQRGRVSGEHSNQRLRPQGQEDRGRVRPLLRCTRSSPVFRFPCIRPYATRGNEEGSSFLEKPPEQEDTKSSPSLSMELKFELDTGLTVSCVVAVASAYGHTSGIRKRRHLFVDPVCFVWLERAPGRAQ